MRIRDRVVLLFLIGGVTTVFDSRGAFRGLDVPLHDAALAAAAPLPRLFASIVANVERCRVIVVTPRQRNGGFTLDEVIDVLSRLGKRQNATAWIALPPGLALTDEKRLGKLATALHFLGRVGLAWPAGDAPAPTRAGLDRVGNGDLLPPATRFSALPSALENALEFVTSDHLEPSVDGQLRALPLAEGAGDRVIPSPPVAIAASVLHESSLALSRDALTLESFGGRDHPLAHPNRLRTRPSLDSHRPLTLEQALELEVDKKEPPVLLVAFEGSPVLAPVAIPFVGERPTIQVFADTAEDLLSARSPHPVSWFTALGYTISSAASGAFAADRRRRYAWLPIALLACAACGLLGLALSSALPPFAAMLASALLGFAVAGKR